MCFSSSQQLTWKRIHLHLQVRKQKLRLVSSQRNSEARRSWRRKMTRLRGRKDIKVVLSPTLSSRVPNKFLLPCVTWASRTRDERRSSVQNKAKSCSLTRERTWRCGLRSRARGLPRRGGAALQGLGRGRGSRGALAGRGQVSAHGPPPPPPSWIAASPAALPPPARAEVCAAPFSTSTLGLTGGGARPLPAPCEPVKLPWAQRKRKKRRLYYPHSIFISGELLMGFAGDRTV